MASPQDSKKFVLKNSVQHWDHDPDGTCAVAVTPDAGTTERWVDMRDFEEFYVSAMSTALTGNGISLLEIVASDSSDGSTNVTQIKTSGAVVCDAVGDWVQESCTAEEIAQESSDQGVGTPGLRYVAGRITVANSADEAAVTYVRCANRAYDDLTPETTIS
jgi:hypothetical protein